MMRVAKFGLFAGILALGLSAAAVDRARVEGEDYSQTFENVPDAFAQLTAGRRLTLLRSVDLNFSTLDTIAIPGGKGPRTINLNGKTINALNGANKYLFGVDPTKPFSKDLVISNGTVKAGCGGFIDMPVSWGNLILKDLTIKSTANRSAYLINAHCSTLAMTNCTIESDYMGCVWVGDTMGTGGEAREATIAGCSFTLKNGTQSFGDERNSACVFASNGSVAILENCTCKALGETSCYALYEGTSLGRIIVRGDKGLYDGELKATKTLKDDYGIYLNGGGFTNCAFVTSGGDEKYFHISGGTYDTDPSVNDGKFIDSGKYADETEEGSGEWKVLQKKEPRLIVTGHESLYDGKNHKITVTMTDPADGVPTYSLTQSGPYEEDDFVFCNATSQVVWVRFEQKGYFVTNTCATVNIGKRAVTMTSGSQTWTYDGLAHSNMTVTVTGDGFAAGEDATYGGFAEVKDETGDAGAENTFGYTLAAKALPVNYDVSQVFGTLKIVPKSNVQVWISGNVLTNKYLGTEQKCSGITYTASSPQFGDADFTYTPTGDSTTNLVATDAGTYRMNLKPADFALAGAQFDSAEFFIVCDGELVINKVEAKRAGGLPVDAYTRDPSDPTKPFSQFDIVTVYDGKGTNVDFKAIKAIKLDPPTSATYEFASTASGPWKQGTTKYHDVVSTSVWYRITSPNTFDYVHEVKLCITNRPVTVTSGTKTDLVYTGRPQAYTNLEVTAGSFVSGQGIVTSNWATVTSVLEGAVDNSFDFVPQANTKLSNYDLTVVTGKIAVAAAPVVNVTITAKAITNAYTGAEHRNDGFTFTSDFDPFFDGSCFSFSGVSNITRTASGETRMNLAPSQFELTSDNWAAANFTIAQDGVLVVTNVPPVTPWGPVDPIDPDPADPSKPFSTNDVTTVYDGQGHTIDTNRLAQLEYVPASTLTFSYALTKDGAYQPDPFVFTNVVTTSYWYKVSSDGADDFVHEAKLTITNRPATLTSGSELFVYDGDWHSNTTVVAENFVEGEGVVTNGFPKIRDYGVVTNSFGYAAAEGTDLANYTITCVTGVLQVTAAPLVTVTAGPGGTASVTAGLVEGHGVPFEPVTVTAVPDLHWQFDRWTGCEIDGVTTNPATFLMPQTNISVKAWFAVSERYRAEQAAAVSNAYEQAGADIDAREDLADEEKAKLRQELTTGRDSVLAEIAAAKTPDEIDGAVARVPADVKAVFEAAEKMAEGVVRFAQRQFETEGNAEFEFLVYGGSTNRSTAVLLNFVKGTYTSRPQAYVDGKRARFPLSLNWTKGDRTPKTVTLKTGKSASATDRFFTLQLGSEVATALGAKDIATVTVRGGKGPDEVPYVRALAWPFNGGKVSGSRQLKSAKATATLQARANGWAGFVGWYRAKEDNPEQIDLENGFITYERKLRVAPGEEGTYYAYFIDVLPVIAVNDPDFTGALGIATNENGIAVCRVGLNVSFPLSFTTAEGDGSGRLTVASLPKGLKFNRKTGLVTGVPTKAGTYAVKMKGRNRSGKHDLSFVIVTEAMPAALVGTFECDIRDASQAIVGSVSMTVSKIGAISARVRFGQQTVKMSTKGFVDAEGYDILMEKKGYGVFTARIVTDASGEPDGTYEGTVEGDFFGGQKFSFTLR